MKISYPDRSEKLSFPLENDFRTLYPNWTLDFTRYPHDAHDTEKMLKDIIPNVHDIELSDTLVIQVAELPEVLNRYEMIYHSKVPRSYK